MTEHAQIEAANFHLLQQVLKATARDKKYKPKPWPTPETAAERIKREDAERGYRDLMEEIVFLPQDDFEAHVAEHRDGQQVIRRQAGN